MVVVYCAIRAGWFGASCDSQLVVSWHWECVLNGAASCVSDCAVGNCAESAREVAAGQYQKYVSTCLQPWERYWPARSGCWTWHSWRPSGVYCWPARIRVRRHRSFNNSHSLPQLIQHISSSVTQPQSKFSPNNRNCISSGPRKPIHIKPIVIDCTIVWSWLVLSNLNRSWWLSWCVLKLESVAPAVVWNQVWRNYEVNWTALHWHSENCYWLPKTQKVLFCIR